jgi:hypothetical protein
VSRRATKPIDLGGKLQGAITETSLVSLVSSMPHLKDVMESKSPYEKQMCDELVKTAAVLKQVTAFKGRYH